MGTPSIRGLLFVVMMLGAAVFPKLQARQAADTADFQSLQIELPVTDVGRTAEFYRDLLEFESPNLLPTRSSNVPARAVFSVGGQYLAISQRLKEGQPTDGIRLVVRVANPGQYAARLRARGVAVNVELTGLDRQPGAFTVVDPDGYRFYFTGGIPIPRQ